MGAWIPLWAFPTLGFLLLGVSTTGQERVRLSGAVRDSDSGETLIGATLETSGGHPAAMTNEYGFYSLVLPAGDSLILSVSHVGFQTHRRRLFLLDDLQLDIELDPGVLMKEVIVHSKNAGEIPEMGMEALPVQQTRLLPMFLGENDLLKALQLKPGIPSGAEGPSGLFVRGGGSDQNLILIDEAPVYNAHHLIGFFSIFNTDAVKDMRLYKGGFPAQYGGRLSSIIDAKLNEGNNKRLSAAGGLGLISSRLTLEGPLRKDRASYILSGRRTYIDLFTRSINRARAGDEDFDPLPNYYFYDLNAKLNFPLGEKNRIFLSSYFGRDVFAFSDDFLDFNFAWGNATGTLRWNRRFNNRLFANTALTLSDYKYTIRNKITGFSFDVSSNIQDASLKSDFHLALNNRHALRFGAQLTHHRFDIGRLRGGSTDGNVTFFAGEDQRGLEFAGYVADEFSLGAKVKLNAGLRLSGFSNGPGSYLRVEPRLTGQWMLSPQIALKGAYARMNQYLHLVSNAGIAFPTDVWYPTTGAIKPQSSDQIALGAVFSPGQQLSMTLETYYKWLKNQVELVDGAQLFSAQSLEDAFAIGEGYGYGVEWSLEKKRGKFTGWIGYTLAFSRRGHFVPVDEGARFSQAGYFSPLYDRRHDLSVVALMEVNRRLNISATFVYGSGDLRWLPPGRFAFQDIYGGEFQAVVPHYLDRNNYRIPPYNRLDLGVVIKFFPAWGENELSIDIINLYNRRNTFFIYLDPEYQTIATPSGEIYEIPVRIAARQVSLFPILPAVSWNFKI